jgi:hypothetical protein
MSNGLAKTTLQTGADDNLAAINIYTQKVTLAPVAQDQNNELSDGLKTLTGAPLSISKNKNEESNDVAAGISSIGGSFNSAFQSLESGLKQYLTSAKGVVGIKMVDGKPKINFNLKSAANIAGIKTMIDVLGNQKGITGKLGIDSQAEFLGKLVKVSTKMGLDGGLKSVMASVSDVKVLNKVAANIGNFAAATSNIGLLSTLSDAKLNGKISLNLNSLVSRFAANFKIPIGTKPGDFLQIGASLSSSFSKLNPKWNVSLTTSGKSIFNGSVMLNSSGDFKLVMKGSANRDRVGFRYNTSNARRSSIPTKPATRSIVDYQSRVGGSVITTRHYPNGRRERFVPSPSTNDYQYEDHTPISVFDPQSSVFDNSGFRDPFTLGHVLSDTNAGLKGLSGADLGLGAKDSLQTHYGGFDLDSVNEQQDLSGL